MHVILANIFPQGHRLVNKTITINYSMCHEYFLVCTEHFKVLQCHTATLKKSQAFYIIQKRVQCSLSMIGAI